MTPAGRQLPAGTAAADLVPLADRLRFLQMLRLALTVLAAAGWAARPDLRGLPPTTLITFTATYLACVSSCSWLAARLPRQHAITAFGASLLLDGLFLTAVSYGAAGPSTPLRYLVLLHLIAVSLLASYRTGLKVALWYSLLLYGVVQLATLGTILPAAAASGMRSGRSELVAAGVVFWLVAVVTTSFSAVNERELRRQRYDLEALAQLSLTLEAATDPTAAAEALADALSDTYGFARVLVLGGPAGAGLRVLAHRDSLRRRVPVGPPQPAGAPADTTVQRAQQERRTLLVDRLDPVGDPWLCTLLPPDANLVIVPLFGEGRAQGVLVAQHDLRHGSRIERRVVALVERFASQTALALAGAWLLAQVRDQASTDGLTGVANRRTFDRALTERLAAARRQGECFALVILDLDNFKRLNDTFGHQAGDVILQRTAVALRGACRAGDLAARFGGEEFAVVLPGVRARDARSVGEGLRAAIAHLDVADLAPDLQVTASVGVAVFPGQGPTGAELVAAADGALYAAKRAGRNCTRVAELLPGPGGPGNGADGLARSARTG